MQEGDGMRKHTTGINLKVENLAYLRGRAQEEGRSLSNMVDMIVEMERKRRGGVIDARIKKGATA